MKEGAERKRVPEIPGRMKFCRRPGPYGIHRKKNCKISFFVVLGISTFSVSVSIVSSYKIVVYNKNTGKWTNYRTGYTGTSLAIASRFLSA